MSCSIFRNGMDSTVVTSSMTLPSSLLVLMVIYVTYLFFLFICLSRSCERDIIIRLKVGSFQTFTAIVEKALKLEETHFVIEQWIQ